MFQSIINPELFKGPEIYLFVTFVVMFMVLANTNPKVLLTFFRTINPMRVSPKKSETKPTWDSAPKSAKWLAQDCDGIWRWHSIKPKHIEGYWVSNEFASMNSATYTDPSSSKCSESLESKPKVISVNS